MKKILFIFTILTAVLVCTTSNAQVMFQKTYQYSCALNAALQTTDGGYAISGCNGNAIYLIRLNSNGDTLWTKNYPGIALVFTDFKQTSSGGFIIIGRWGHGPVCPILIKTDSNGNPAFEKIYNSNIQNACSVEEAIDGGYFVGGINSGGDSFFLIKTDSMGHILFSNSYAHTYNNWAYTVKSTPDGGCIVAGFSFSTASLTKVNSNGNVAWQKAFNGTNSTGLIFMERTADGGYIISGAGNLLNDTIPNYGILYLIKVDSAANLQWAKCYPRAANGGTPVGVTQTSDMGYAVINTTNAFAGIGMTNYNAVLIKTDSVGTTLWSKIYGGSGSANANTVKQTTDNGYIISGVYSDSLISDDTYIIKTDANGNSGCKDSSVTINDSVITPTVTLLTPVVSTYSFVGDSALPRVTLGSTVQTFCTNVTGVNELAMDSDYSIYPNPTNGAFMLELKGVEIKNLKVEVSNVLGEIVYESLINSKQSSIDLSNQASGIYFVRVIDSTQALNKRIVKE